MSYDCTLILNFFEVLNALNAWSALSGGRVLSGDAFRVCLLNGGGGDVCVNETGSNWIHPSYLN